MKIKLAKLALRISLIYGMVGCVWILLSSSAVAEFFPDPETRARLEIYKGWAFVVVTALLLYVVLRGHLWQWEREATGRKRTEEALRNSERLLRSVMDLVPHFIFVKDRQSRHLLVNRACAEACKLTPEQMVGRSDLDLAPDSTLAKSYMQDDQEVITSGRPKFVPEEQLTDAHGRTRFLQTTKIPFPSSAIPFPVAGNGKPAILGVAVDITERKKAEDALRERHAQLTEALQIARLAYWEYDVASDQFTFNDQFYGLLRTTAKREGGYAMSSAEYAKRFVHPDDRVMVREKSQKSLIATDPNFTQQFDHRIIYGDGEVGYFSIHVRIEKDAQGHTIRTHGANLDITERKRAELQVAESRNYLSKIINSITDPIFVKDRRHRWVLLNEAFCDFMGRQRSELLGKSDCDFFPKHEADVFWAKDELVFSTGKENINEEKFTDGQGVVRTIQTKKGLYTDDKGEQFILGIIRDITERTRAEQALQMFQFSIDQASDAIFWMTQDAGFSYVNDQACRSLGYTREELMQLRLWDIDPVFPKERWDTEWKQFQENRRGGVQQVETFHRRKDGSKFPVNISSKHLWFGDTELHVAVARDITERRQAEEKLEYEQALFQTLLETTPDNIYFKDRESRFVRVSRSKVKDTLQTVRQTYGAALSETVPDQWPAYLASVEAFAQWLIGKTDFDTYPETHARVAYADEQEIIRTGQPLMGKLEKATLPDGKEIWWLSTKLPWRDKDGHIIGTFGVSRDVTAVKEAEAALNQERLLLRAVIDNLPDFIYAKDKQGRFVLNNLIHAKALGAESPQAMLGKTDFDYFPRELAAQFFADEKRIIESQEPLLNQEQHFAAQGNDGVQQCYSASKVLWRDHEGNVLGTVGITRDITDRKRADEELLQLNRSLETLSKCNEALVRATDEPSLLAKICQIITEVGGYRMAWVGYAELDDAKSVRPVAQAGAESGYLDQLHVTWAETELGRGPVGTAIRTGQPAVVLNLAENPAFTPWRQEALRRGYSSSIGLPLRAGNKTFGVLCVYSSRPDAFNAAATALLEELADDLAFGISSLRNRGERNQLEEQLRQSQKMEAIGRLAGGVAHDFNNMLTVIQGNASLLLNPQLDPKEWPACSRQIAQAAERAAGLTRQLLIFSRKQVLQPADVDLNEVVGNMTKMLRRILGEDIMLQTSYASQPVFIHADIGMIEQVLMNLLVNARDAMPSGGQLSISTERQDIPEAPVGKNADAQAGPHVCLTVSDTGCGIPGENLPRIFDPFFTTKEAGKGTGLGLATVYSIVQQHRGWITVASEVNKGTTFKIYLPAVKGELMAKEPTSQKLLQGSGTILVVEDELAVRTLVCHLLQRCGYTVLQAESGTDALKIWQERQGKIQLLLTDIIMPDGINGYELAKQLKAAKPKLKVVYTSGYSGEVVGKRLELVEGVNFLQKPYVPQKLLQVLRDNLDGTEDGNPRGRLSLATKN